MESIWHKGTNPPRFESLNQNIKTDVAIIGGGITGILCAHMMQNAGVNCVLIEADKICCGITKNTTAKITYQHGLIYAKMIKRFGIDVARLYMEAQSEALESYLNICKTISCDFNQCDSFVYSTKSRQVIENEAKALESIGCKAYFSENLPLPISIAGAVGIKNQAQFNPLKFLYEIAKNLPIFENTKVLELKPDCIITDKGKIKAEKIVVATHFPLLNKHGSYFLKMYQHRSYVIALENAQKLNGMYVDEDKRGMSFRSCDNTLLIGGGSHRTGKKGGNWHELSCFAKKYYPNANELCRFATQDCITLDDIAYIGQYSKNTPSLFVATGFNKWGMTNAMTAAMILTDLVQDKHNKYAEIFSPSRSIIRPQLAVNAFETLASLITPSTPRCPHMGCALKYNQHEHSWDCPCHGSRFEKNGKLIDNPSCDDLKN